MRDYCDGQQFSDHLLFKTDPNALQIQLYYDDADVCNPIGSKSTIHKLGKECMYTYREEVTHLHIYVT